jgi:hypothetical protein
MHHCPSFRAVCLVALLSAAGQSPADALATTPPINPDPAIRALWTRLAHQTSSDDGYKALAELDQVGAKGKAVEVIQQALALSAEEPEAEGLYLLQLGAVIPMLRLSQSKVLRAAVPMLECADNGQREQAETFLGLVLGWQPQWISDEDLCRYFQENCPEPPARFAGFLSSLAPRTALLSLDAAYPEPDRHRVVLWAEHVVADAIWKQEHDFLKSEDTAAALAQLAELSELDEWWARLYVAEVISKNRFLRDDKLIERLKKDKHESVRRAAQRAE